jgi:hypothetical protein
VSVCDVYDLRFNALYYVDFVCCQVRQCLDYRQKEIRLLASNALLEQLVWLDRALAHNAAAHARVVDMFVPYVSLLVRVWCVMVWCVRVK